MIDFNDVAIVTKGSLRDDWKDFAKILIENNIYCLYHFTDKRNLKSIKKYRAIYSRKILEDNQIKFFSGGDLTSKKLEEINGLNNYVHLSFTSRHPMVKSRDEVYKVSLQIDPRIIFSNEAMFSNLNSNDSKAKIGETLEFFKKIRLDVTQKNYFDLNSIEKKYHQAEVLVNECVPVRYFPEIWY